MKLRFTILFPAIAVFLYCFIIYVIRFDAANAIDENDRMVSTMILIVVHSTLLPTFLLTEMVSDCIPLKNAYIFYGITALIHFSVIGVLTDIAISLFQKRHVQEMALENQYWIEISKAKMKFDNDSKF